MKKINDFGQKIGGAKKDMWAIFKELSEERQSEMAKRDVLWKRPNSKDLPKEVLFWQCAMRRAVKPRPKTGTENETYVKFCLAFKEKVEACNSMEDIKAFYEKDILNFMIPLDDHRWKYVREYRSFFDGNKVLRYVKDTERQIKCDVRDAEQFSVREITAINSVKTKTGFKYKCACDGRTLTFQTEEDLTEMAKKTGKLFMSMNGKRLIGCYPTKEEAEKSVEATKMAEKRESKDRFLPPHLSYIERTGSNYKFFRLTDGNVLMARYGLKGGEFGNWATAKDRLGSINMCYDAFEDLADCLGVQPKDISLGGDLSIAFGARGKGSAMAHYESDRNVINITRLRGAGSLAHEWGHALDMYVGRRYGTYGFLSAACNGGGSVFKEANDLVNAFWFNEDGTPTEFFEGSKIFDETYSKAGNGYWSSTPELFARAFACYVKDKLGDRKSDYLVGHAECARNGKIVAYPVGAERERINEKFDTFFAKLVEDGVLTAEVKAKKVSKAEASETSEIFFFEGDGGQLRFC